MQVRVIPVAVALLLSSTMLASAQGKKDDQNPAGPAASQSQGAAQRAAPAEGKGPPAHAQEKRGPSATGAEARKEAQSPEPKGKRSSEADGKPSGNAEKGKADAKRTAQPDSKQGAPVEKGKADQKRAAGSDNDRKGVSEKGKADAKRTAEPDTKQVAPAEKGKADTNRTAQPDSKQGGPAEKGKADTNRTAQPDTKQGGPAGKGKADTNRTAEPKAGDAAGKDQAAVASGPAERVQIDDQKRTRIVESFRSERTRIKHYTNVNVSIDVGRRLPRTYTYHEVPRFVVEVAPQYRGYRYVWVENRYVIVEPTTYVIVGWVEADTGYVYVSGGSSRHARAGGSQCDVRLDQAERRHVLAVVQQHRPLALPGISIGVSVPDSVEVYEFPDPVRREVSEVASCGFVVLPDRRVAIVEPSTRRIVTIIEER